jgi:hypothetical protein
MFLRCTGDGSSAEKIPSQTNDKNLNASLGTARVHQQAAHMELFVVLALIS